MTSRRLLALLLALQFLALLLLTQTWFTISMRRNGSLTSLGEFDGATTYSSAMPTTLFAIASCLVALLTKTKTKRVFLGLAALASTWLAIFLSLQVLVRNVSGLDPQLERLTGIAKTHGVTDLTIQTSLFPWMWLVVTALEIACAAWLAISGAVWSVALPNNHLVKAKRAPTSTIELWEQQRD
jgi:hypothetical protein